MAEEATAVIEMRGLGRTFDSSPPVHALRDVDLRVERGEHVAIVGPSGSGKSTLLHIMGLLDQPTAGTYLLDGHDVSGLGERERSAVRGGSIGFVFQSFHLLEHRSVLENVALGELYRGAPREGRRRRALDALERVQLEHRAGFRPSTLSGGERQRVAIARALVGQPLVLLADEPTGNLDSRTGRTILAHLRALRAQGLTIVVVTHDPMVAEEATSGCYRAVDGRLRRTG